MWFKANHNLVNTDVLTTKYLLDENTLLEDIHGVWYLLVPPGTMQWIISEDFPWSFVRICVLDPTI